MLPTVPFRWTARDNRTVTANVAYTALASLFTLEPFVDRAQLTASYLDGTANPTIRVFGQRISDNVFVSLGDLLSLAINNAESQIFEIPEGIYDNIAYELTGLGSSGVDMEFVVRYNPLAA